MYESMGVRHCVTFITLKGNERFIKWFIEKRLVVRLNT